MKRCAVVVVAAYGLGACAGYSEGTGLLDSSFWDTGALFVGNDRAEYGIAEMAKGNYAMAEAQFGKALKADPKDTHALLGLGILYQNTGRMTKAKEMYESILAIRPKDEIQMVVWKEFSTRPVSEIASVNLAMLESGGVLSSMEGGSGDSYAAPPGYPADAGNPAVMNTPSSPAMLGRTAPTPGVESRARAAGLAPVFSGSDANVMSRFKTIAALRDQGLITLEEYSTRRMANIGALLPLTSPPPAAGLDRSVPTSDQISGRIRAIGRALEMRAITIGQHSAERSMILDALMPSAPVSVVNPGAPPSGLMQAADAVRKLEMLQNEMLITTDEYTRERAAIEQAMQPAGMAPSAAPGAGTVAASPAELQAMSASSGPQPAVHLASYRSQKAANRGWAQLKRAHKALLGNLSSDISKVNLGPGKGVFYRLKVGPLDNEAASTDICKKLKRRRQYCEPSFMNAG